MSAKRPYRQIARSASTEGLRQRPGRALSPDAAPDEIGSAVMDMPGDKALCWASQSFASAVPRFGELAHAADLIVQAV
jgi:hypothetical protein